MRIKKFVCAAAAAVLCFGFAEVGAEVQSNAIGLRLDGLGGDMGYEINYQREMSLIGSKRLELGGGFWGGDGWSWIQVHAVPQWHWNISGGFNWYVGPGVGVGFWSYKTIDADMKEVSKGELILHVGGQIGVEYDFNVSGVPLNLSIDTRPMIDLLHSSGVSVSSIINGGCIGIRYTF